MEAKKVLVKFGGSVERDIQAKKNICADIVKLYKLGYEVTVVHGGGKEIDRWLTKVGLESKFYKGLRITDKDTMEIVEMVLAGKVNKDIVSILCSMGGPAIGLCGKDGGMLTAEILKPIDENGQPVDIGYVGTIVDVDTKAVKLLMDNGFISVIAPIGNDKDGNYVNINADYVAANIAAKLDVDNLVFLTDVDGVYKNYNKEGMSLLDKITVAEVSDCIAAGFISDGMIPKIDCCLEAIKKGVRKVSIINGSKEGVLIQKILENSGVGTTIIKE